MKEVNNLFNKALSNFDCAKIIRQTINSDEDESLNQIAYHLQQALELSIKYTLEMNGVEYPYVHRIEDLLKVAKDNDVELYVNEYIKEHDAMFSSWESNTRYVIGFLADIEKIDKAIPQIEEYLRELIEIYND